MIYYKAFNRDMTCRDFQYEEGGIYEIKDLGYKKSFIKSWEEPGKEDRERVKDLPNFDADVFYELSGIKV